MFFAFLYSYYLDYLDKHLSILPWLWHPCRNLKTEHRHLRKARDREISPLTNILSSSGKLSQFSTIHAITKLPLGATQNSCIPSGNLWIQGDHVIQHSFRCMEVNLEPTMFIINGSKVTVAQYVTLTRHLHNASAVWGLSWQQLGGSVVLAWQQLETKATIVREWSAVLHAGVGGQGKLPLCMDAAQAMAGVNLINCFQAVNEDLSIKCVVDENVHNVPKLIFCPWVRTWL